MTTPSASMVTGKEIKHISASSQPLISAKIKSAIKAKTKLMNMGTFSPIPSSNFDKSLWRK